MIITLFNDTKSFNDITSLCFSVIGKKIVSMGSTELGSMMDIT